MPPKSNAQIIYSNYFSDNDEWANGSPQQTIGPLPYFTKFLATLLNEGIILLQSIFV
jgi:hypothetical protein